MSIFEHCWARRLLTASCSGYGFMLSLMLSFPFCGTEITEPSSVRTSEVTMTRTPHTHWWDPFTAPCAAIVATASTISSAATISSSSAAKSLGSAFLLNADCPRLGPGWLQSVYSEKGVNNAQVAAFNWMGNWLHGSCGEERWSIGTWNSEVSAEWYKHADQVLLWGTLLLLWFPNRH